jgi:bifunctional non-homologous end joining protein LigD
VRALLTRLDLESFLKTTGGKGLHVVVPIRPRLEWDAARTFCKQVADALVRAAPDRYIATMSKARRHGKVFIDYLRNARGATSVAPYSTRARAGAACSVPLTWDELTSRLRSDHFTLANLPKRLARPGHEPWVQMAAVKQSVTQAMLKSLA